MYMCDSLGVLGLQYMYIHDSLGVLQYMYIHDSLGVLQYMNIHDSQGVLCLQYMNWCFQWLLAYVKELQQVMNLLYQLNNLTMCDTHTISIQGGFIMF